MINGDISGNAEKFVEHQYQDKVVALWSMGAAADQYPKYNWDMGLLDDKASVYAPVEMQGGMIGGEVMKVTRRITQMTDSARLDASERIVACEMNVPQAGPGNPAGTRIGPSSGAAAAPDAGATTPPRPPQMQLKQLLPPPNPGDKLDINLGLIRLNQLAITGVSGEVGSGIFQHLKKESPFPDTMMITLSNNRVGYIPDDAGWDHQGTGQAFVRGCAEQAIVGNLVEMMKATLR
jgi:hypothetical protein